MLANQHFVICFIVKMLPSLALATSRGTASTNPHAALLVPEDALQMEVLLGQ